MQNLLSSLVSGHALIVVGALFVGLSSILNAVAIYLQSIGDKVPSWLGTISSGLGSVLHLLNGNLAGAAPASQPSAAPTASPVSQ